MTIHLDTADLFQRLQATPQEIEDFCQRWHITELALFGSILREDFDPNHSDVDVLATFEPTYTRSLDHMMQMQDELEHLCGRKVDIISRSSLESSSNWITKRNIFNAAQVIYARKS